MKKKITIAAAAIIITIVLAILALTVAGTELQKRTAENNPLTILAIALYGQAKSSVSLIDYQRLCPALSETTPENTFLLKLSDWTDCFEGLMNHLPEKYNSSKISELTVCAQTLFNKIDQINKGIPAAVEIQYLISGGEFKEVNAQLEECATILGAEKPSK